MCKQITDKGLAILPTSLKKLTLYCCEHLTGDDLTNLAHLQHLEELNLSSCTKITAKGFITLPISLKKLES